jgi:hypothetical protein
LLIVRQDQCDVIGKQHSHQYKQSTGICGIHAVLPTDYQNVYRKHRKHRKCRNPLPVKALRDSIFVIEIKSHLTSYEVHCTDPISVGIASGAVNRPGSDYRLPRSMHTTTSQKVRSASYESRNAAPELLQPVVVILSLLKNGKMIEFLLALLLAADSTGGDTGNIPPTPPPPGS